MLSIVVPVYCGEKTLTDLVKRIYSLTENALSGRNIEVILVDDKSPDQSFEVIRELCAKYDNVLGVRLKNNCGQQNATFCGLHYASGDLIVTMDDDLQHDPGHIPILLSRISEETDLVYGVFQTRSDGYYRQAGSKLTAQFFKRKYKILNRQRVSSFRAIHKTLKDKIINEQRGFIYLSCLLLEKSSGVKNVLLPYEERYVGTSNYNFIKLAKLYMKLQMYYGRPSSVFEKLPMNKKEAFEVDQVVKHGHKGDDKNENHDAGWRNESALCH